MEDRLNKLLKYKGLTSAQFADHIDVQRSSISHILSGRNKPSFDFIKKTLSNYPDISPEWLILGQGEMLKSKNNTNSTINVSKNSNDLFNTVRSEDQAEYITNKKDENESHIPKITNVNKNLIKIILFYDDGSFEDFDK